MADNDPMELVEIAPGVQSPAMIAPNYSIVGALPGTAYPNSVPPESQTLMSSTWTVQRMTGTAVQTSSA
jgi:hypothetical protein